MKPIEIAKDIYDVGVTDWNIRDFHGYSTYLGTTYNAFLILDEKIVLIDTVKKEFADQYLDHIAQVIDPKKIDIVISNHTEMDHSGSLPRVMHRIGEDKPVICSKMGLKNLSLHYRQKFNYKDVENGEMLSIGKRTLNFLETRMLHWPDSMFTYIKEDGILISSDAFGQHYAGWQKFDDQIGDAIMAHAKKYFANILLLYSPKILKLVETVTEAGLNIRMICPDHGILWRKDPKKIINAWADLGRDRHDRHASPEVAPKRYHDRGFRCRRIDRRITHPEQRTVSHSSRFLDLHERAETQKQDCRRFRILWLERRIGQVYSAGA